jgi:hypothetical protein
MSKRRAQISDTPDHWIVTEDYIANGRHLVPGTEIKIRTEPGRFKFTRHVRNGDIEWIDVRDKDGRFRSFRINRIKTVHIKKKLRDAA